MAKPAYQRIMERITIDNNGCWLWPGTTDGRGYGRMWIGLWKGKRYRERTHRIMYMAIHGPIPNNMVVRHKCDVKRCCNPYHLEIGTKSDNAYDYYNRQRQAALPDGSNERSDIDGEGLIVPPF